MEYETPVPPEIEYPTKIEVPFSLLKDSINDIDIFSDKIALTINEEKLIAAFIIFLVLWIFVFKGVAS